MKAMMKKTAAVMLAGMLAAGTLTGCAQKNVDYATTVVATYGDTPIYLDEANFMARYNQWYNELYYMGYFGEEMWNQDIGGKTLEAATKEDVMAALLQTEALIAHAEEYGVSLTDADMEKVDQACSDFFEQSQKLVEATGATEELVKRIYEKNALANKVWQAVVADTDTQVSPEESQQVGIRYILVREEAAEQENAETEAAGETTAGETAGNGETAGSGEGETAAAAETPETKANAIVSRIQAGEDIGDVAEELGLTCNTGHYAKYPAETGDEEGEEGTSVDILGTNAAAMAEGEARAVYGESADGWYVIYCDTENDEEATENEVDQIIRERKSARFAEVYAGWDKAEFKVDEDVWELVAFDGNPVYVEEPVTAGTDAGETEAVTGSSEASETEAAGSETTEAGTTASGETEADTTAAAE